MSSHLRNKEERLQEILGCLVEESSKGVPIIVEGRKDIETLRHLGVTGRIIAAKTGGKSRLDVVCEIEESKTAEVIVLMDFDRRGKEWTRTLKQSLEKMQVIPNLTFWTELNGLAGRDIKDVEGLATYMLTLRRKIGDI